MSSRIEDFLSAFRDYKIGSDRFGIEQPNDMRARMVFDIDAISPLTTRKIIVPDADVDLGQIGAGNNVLEAIDVKGADTVTNTTAETKFASEFTWGTDGTVNSIPDNSMIRLVVFGSILSVTGTPTLDLRLRAGGAAAGGPVIASLSVGLSVADVGDQWRMECELVWDKGISRSSGQGAACFNTNALTYDPPSLFQNNDDRIIVTAQWSVASAANEVDLWNLHVLGGVK